MPSFLRVIFRIYINKIYNIIAGIPDFRILPSPNIDVENNEVNTLLKNYYNLDYIELYRLRQSFLLKVCTEKSAKEAMKLHESNLKNLLDYHLDYSNIFSTNINRFRHLIGKRILHKEDIALEIGCGKGTQINDILSIYDYVVAIDISLEDLIVAKKLLDQKRIADRTQLVCACSEALQFDSDSFDHVNMRYVLEHVEDQ